MPRHGLSWIFILIAAAPVLGQREFGFDNTKPSGQPYLKPEESVRRMKPAPGFEVKLFAAEPDVINPIAMTVDEKGRVWVIECFEYPKRTAKGKMPRDRIVILEDTDGDGICDKRTVFAEGKDFPESFDLASGLEVGHGGVFVGAPPCLWFIENKNDKPGKFTKLLSGFGSQDTHETLNTFQWGPDGKLYGLHGVFTHSDVKPAQADGPTTRMNAAVWRYDYPNQKFEIFAEGTSNPWGMDYRNTDGQFVLCCCVIPHLFHISPGGIYRRQAGQSFHPHAYDYLNEICDHTFHKKSGWAHAGLLSLDTPLMPKEYQNSVIFGSIHGCSIKRNTLKPKGATFIASEADDFLISGDKNFRPINLRWGPNGEIYCIDWHDQNPCHQTKPDDWDYERGRVYRIQPNGLQTKKAENLAALDPRKLSTVALTDPNPYRFRTALRLLGEAGKHPDWDVDDVKQTDSLRLTWFFHSIGSSDAKRPLGGTGLDPIARAWSVRRLADQEKISPTVMAQLTTLALNEKVPEVRRELANLAIRHGSNPATKPLLKFLLEKSKGDQDQVVSQLLWLAYQPHLVKSPSHELNWLLSKCADNPYLLHYILPRAMRRLVATNQAQDLETCVSMVAEIRDLPARRHMLEGLAEALKNQQVDAPPSWKKVLARLRGDNDQRIQELANRLAVSFRDREAIARALKLAEDASLSVKERASAINDLGLAKPPEALPVLREVLLTESSDLLRQEACRALAGYDHPGLAASVLGGWKRFSPPVKNEAIQLLAGRKAWAKELLAAVGDKKVSPGDLNVNTILRIRAFKDMALNEQIEKVWGKFRDTPAELNALIDKMRGELNNGPASFARGKLVFDANCGKCHKFDGRGHDVGPPIDGAARDIEYLLANILDPNRVVGQPYFTRVVELKDGRIETGLLHAEDDNSITLKVENAVLKVIQKKDIEGKVQVQTKSVMPEGLDKNMSVQDFRDLVRYTMAHPFINEVIIGGPATTAQEAADFKKMRRLIAGANGRLPLPSVEKEGRANVVILAEVTSPQAMKSQLLLGAAAEVAVKHLNKKLYQGKPGNEVRPDQVAIPVDLHEGVNLFYFEVRYTGANQALYARLLDPDRRLRHPESEKK